VTGLQLAAYLQHLPRTELERSVTAGVDDDHRAAAIVEHTVALGLRLVGEDVRTGAALAALGYRVAQG
jgi:EAL domain-containing protein (putative c-di-GMP-specific phosphodiesterase class I)